MPIVPQRPTLSSVLTGPSSRPSGGIILGPEGVGKTSLGACAFKPIFIMLGGEVGLETLIGAGRVPPTPRFPELDSFDAVMSCIEALREGRHDYKTLVIDALNGLERLVHEHVCKRDYGGRWGKDGFLSYMQGYENSLADWRLLLKALDRLRNERRMAVIMLGHTRVATFKNPEGPDYDRFTPDVHPKTWGLTHKWADYVLFLHFETFVEEGKSTRAKGKGGTRRVIHSERSSAWDAKNRFGLPNRIDCGASPQQAWKNLVAAFAAAKAAAPSAPVNGSPATPKAPAATAAIEATDEVDDTDEAEAGEAEATTNLEETTA